MTGTDGSRPRDFSRLVFAPRRVKFIPHGHDGVASPLDVTRLSFSPLLSPILPPASSAQFARGLPAVFLFRARSMTRRSRQCVAPSLIMVSRVARRFVAGSLASEGNGWFSGWIACGMQRAQRKRAPGKRSVCRIPHPRWRQLAII